MAPTRLAAIDVGSNAMRLRVAEADPRTAEWTELTSVRAPVRLGRDVFTSGMLSAQTLDDACSALGDFRRIMDEHEVSSYRAVATSATREATNGAVFVARARREAGVDLDPIDGHEEARLVHVAVARRVALTGRTALVDIGGGSTEVTVLEGGRQIARTSLPLGTVRLLAAWHPRGGPVGRKRLRVLAEVVARALAEVAPAIAGADHVIATGGAVRAIAKLCSREATVCKRRMASLVDRLRSMDEKERIATFGLRADRADTILPAAMVLGGIASAADVSSFVTPFVGVRDGILAELAQGGRTKARSSRVRASIRPHARMLPVRAREGLAHG